MSVEGAAVGDGGWDGEGAGGRPQPPSTRAMAHATAAVRHVRDLLMVMVGIRLEQQGSLLHRIAWCDMDLPHDAGSGGAQLILHLHRFHHHEALSGAYRVTLRDVHAYHEPRHGGEKLGRPGHLPGRARKLANRATSFIERFDAELESLHGEVVLSAMVAATPENAVDLVSDLEELIWCRRQVFEARRDRRFPLERDGLAVDGDFELLIPDPNEVFHAAGTSSHTVSTCAVCGNMSKARTELTLNASNRRRSRASVAGSQLT